jgi:hypothetical protein
MRDEDKDAPSLCPGDSVVLLSVPEALLKDLPVEDQAAIKKAVGGNVSFVDFDKFGDAELEFTDDEGVLHSIWVSPDHIQPKR